MILMSYAFLVEEKTLISFSNATQCSLCEVLCVINGYSIFVLVV